MSGYILIMGFLSVFSLVFANALTAMTSDEDKTASQLMLGVVMYFVPPLVLSAVSVGLLWAYPPSGRGWLFALAMYVFLQGLVLIVLGSKLPPLREMSVTPIVTLWSVATYLFVIVGRGRNWARAEFGPTPDSGRLVVAAVVPTVVVLALVAGGVMAIQFAL